MEISLKAEGDGTDYKAFIRTALENYDIRVNKAELIKHNENITSEIFAEEGNFILRVRKPRDGFSLNLFNSGISSSELLRNETELLLYISNRSSLPFQAPIKTKAGDYVCDVYGYPTCLLSFIEGASLLPKNTAHLQAEEHSVCIRAFDAIDPVMTRLDSSTGIHLIHADLGMGNILLTSKGLTAIDFSLCGYGYPAMECGMLASNFSSDEAIEKMRLAYNRVSGMNVSSFDTNAFLAMSVMLFIAFQHTRYYKEEWFTESMKHWSQTCLEPENW